MLSNSVSPTQTIYFSVKTRGSRTFRKTCYVTTRARAVTRRYWLARTALRYLAKFALLSGHRKASW